MEPETHTDGHMREENHVTTEADIKVIQQQAVTARLPQPPEAGRDEADSAMGSRGSGRGHLDFRLQALEL